MKQTITESEFIEAFDIMGREDNFTHNGRRALFRHLTDWERDTGKELELDVIGICCEWTEYANEAECREAYGLDEEENLEFYTTVIQVDESFYPRIIVMDW
jgi:hypothetical protein